MNSPNPNSFEPSRILPLDGFRGLAIFGVTIYRFWIQELSSDRASSIAEQFLRLGGLGVDLFFVLSGYLITRILCEDRDQPGFLKPFFLRRMLRVFPIYFGTLILTLVVLPSFGLKFTKPWVESVEEPIWLWTFSANLYLTQQESWSLGWFNHFWSLAIEEQFYFIWPFIIAFLPLRNAFFLSVGLVLMSVTLRLLFVFTNHPVVAETFTLCRFDGLACGSALALWQQSKGLSREWLGKIRWFALVLGFVLATITISGRTMKYLPYTGWACFFTTMIYLILHLESGGFWYRILSSRVLCFLARYSFGMYVFQNLLIPVVAPWFSISILTGLIAEPFLARTIYVAGMFGLTILTALISWHCFESPILSLKSVIAPRRTSPVIRESRPIRTAETVQTT